MEIKYKKPKYLITLILSGVLLSLGLIGLLLYQEKYKELSNVCIIFGSLGIISGLLMLFYGLVYIYEAEFDAKGISFKKRTKEEFIDYYDISDLDYVKPSLFNYITATGGKLYPGTVVSNKLWKILEFRYSASQKWKKTWIYSSPFVL